MGKLRLHKTTLFDDFLLQYIFKLARAFLGTGDTRWL
jgi:hypothetical protein